ncbi:MULTISPECIES: hypothetical protein [unclassified Bradyrhizobium]|uniref:hypothetical protein n=1 Tax=unclassified Bradyrhizobium TaxID=2631580 RepID=UPI002916409F|nr:MULTISPECIES: hypothetical protein [unclassified Bradyrhizobium]
MLRTGWGRAAAEANQSTPEQQVVDGASDRTAALTKAANSVPHRRERIMSLFRMRKPSHETRSNIAGQYDPAENPIVETMEAIDPGVVALDQNRTGLAVAPADARADVGAGSAGVQVPHCDRD